MKKTTIKLLMKWMVHVMYMLCARAEIFSDAERTELAEITADLQGAITFDELL